jgi:hypothetical protein
MLISWENIQGGFLLASGMRGNRDWELQTKVEENGRKGMS